MRLSVEITVLKNLTNHIKSQNMLMLPVDN
jgi:hypothetical protein